MLPKRVHKWGLRSNHTCSAMEKHQCVSIWSTGHWPQPSRECTLFNEYQGVCRQQLDRSPVCRLGRTIAPLVNVQVCPQFLKNLIRLRMRTSRHSGHSRVISPPLWRHTEWPLATASKPAHIGWWDCELWVGNYNVTSIGPWQYIWASIHTGFGTTDDKPHIVIGVSHREPGWSGSTLKEVDESSFLFDGLSVHLPTCQCAMHVDDRDGLLGHSYPHIPHIVLISMTEHDASCTVSHNPCSTAQ